MTHKVNSRAPQWKARHYVYFGVTDKGVTDKSGRYPPAPITKATIEPVTAKRTRSESVATRNFISYLRVFQRFRPQSIAQR
jgi:hypothetical protein